MRVFVHKNKGPHLKRYWQRAWWHANDGTTIGGFCVRVPGHYVMVFPTVPRKWN